MGRVQVSQVFPGSVHEAETCWYDTGRWPEWISGLVRVIAVDGGWPREGAAVIWESGPAGRGQVREKVTAYEPLTGQTLQVQDDSIRGTQRVEFTPAEGGVEVTLSLEYSITRRSPFTPIVDLLFVRRPMTISLTDTVTRFGALLADSRRSSVG